MAPLGLGLDHHRDTPPDDAEILTFHDNRM
jgi:hypothetical protein